MSIGAIGTIVTQGDAATAVSRPELAGVHPIQAGAPPPPPEGPESTQPNATVTTLSDEARAQRTAGHEPPPTSPAPVPPSPLTNAVSSDWAAGVPAVDDPVVKEALDALDEASRENAQSTIDASEARRR